MPDVTNILNRIEDGDPTAAEKLLPLVYEELRKLAASRMAEERPDHTLEATALVHEAFLRLVDVERAQKWNSRGHFFGAAAEAMRRILVDQARRKSSQRAGGEHRRIALSIVEPESSSNAFDLLALDEVLQQFALVDPRACEVVKLRYFAGLTVSQVAELQGVSVATTENDWVYAKSWLKMQLSDESPSSV